MCMPLGPVRRCSDRTLKSAPSAAAQMGRRKLAQCTCVPLGPVHRRSDGMPEVLCLCSSFGPEAIHGAPDSYNKQLLQTLLVQVTQITRAYFPLPLFLLRF